MSSGKVVLMIGGGRREKNSATIKRGGIKMSGEAADAVGGDGRSFHRRPRTSGGGSAMTDK